MYGIGQFFPDLTSGIEQIHSGKREKSSFLIKRARILQVQYKKQR